MSAHLSIGAKMAVVCGLFCAPMAAALGLLIAANAHEVAQTRAAMAGNAYLRQVWSAVSTVAQGGGGGEGEGDVGETPFRAAPAAAAFRRALDRHERLTAGAGLIRAVADGSRLGLDLDADGAQAVDAEVVRLPSLLVAIDALGPGAAGPQAGASPVASADQARAASEAVEASLTAAGAGDAAVRAAAAAVQVQARRFLSAAAVGDANGEAAASAPWPPISTPPGARSTTRSRPAWPRGRRRRGCGCSWRWAAACWR